MKDSVEQLAISSEGDERFFLRVAIVISLVIVAGFSMSIVMGRSSFASPLRVHLHAVLFMGWMAIFLAQNIFAATDRWGLHRKLGWLAAAWLVPMVISGVAVTVAMVRNGTVPFFFQPVHFLIFDPLAVVVFATLTVAAVSMRNQTSWHRRLHVCAMTILMAPAFGRLLPLPFVQPWAWELAFAVSLAFLLLVIALDVRRKRLLHAAWIRGVAVIIGLFAATQALAYGPVGAAIYAYVVAGSPGEDVAPLEFGEPPPGLQITGRP